MLAVCQAVGYAHLHGVVHCDLKPANVMMGAHGEVQVLDWGLARRLGSADQAPLEALQPADESGVEPGPGGPALGPGMTVAGAILGTPVYMSPQAARGEPVGPAGDVWSLGVMLHQLATGQTPQAGQTAEQQLARLRQGAGMTQAESALGEVPLELLAIVAKALAPLPADRYSDASDLAEDLARWLDGKRIRAHSYTPAQLLARLVKAWKIPLGVAGIAALLLAGLGAWSVQRIAGQRDRAQAAEATAGLALTRADAALTQALRAPQLVPAAAAQQRWQLTLPQALLRPR